MEITIPPDPLTETTNRLLSIFRQAVDEEARRAANDGIALEDYYRAVQTAAACQCTLAGIYFLAERRRENVEDVAKRSGQRIADSIKAAVQSVILKEIKPLDTFGMLPWPKGWKGTA